MDLRELPTTPFVRHPWETARAAFFADVVLRRSPPGRPVAVLDVGAGDGYLARGLLARLPPGSTVTCVDLHYSPAQIEALSRDAPPGLVFAREAPNAHHDWILLLDVLEHVGDDVGMLGGFTRRHLAAGGTVLVSVPAWPALYTRHDVVLGHHRRYRPGELASTIERAGLDRLEGGSLFSSLVLPRCATKLLELSRGVHSEPRGGEAESEAHTDAAHWRGSHFLTRALHTALVLDGRAGRALARRGLSLPGLSVWMVARPKETLP